MKHVQIFAASLLALGLLFEGGRALGQRPATYHELSPEAKTAFDAELKRQQSDPGNRLRPGSKLEVEPMIPVCVNGQGKITAAEFGDTIDCDPNETQSFLPLSSEKLNFWRSALLQERDMKLHVISPK